MEWLKPEDWQDLRRTAFWFGVIVASNIVFEAFLLWRKGEPPFAGQKERLRGLMPMAPFIIVMLMIVPVQEIMKRHGVDDWRAHSVLLLLVAVPTFMLWRLHKRKTDQQMSDDSKL